MPKVQMTSGKNPDLKAKRQRQGMMIFDLIGMLVECIGNVSNVKIGVKHKIGERYEYRRITGVTQDEDGSLWITTE